MIYAYQYTPYTIIGLSVSSSLFVVFFLSSFVIIIDSSAVRK
jgi:hypothetical protein